MKQITFLFLFSIFCLTNYAQETTRVFTSPGETEKMQYDSLSEAISIDTLNAEAFSKRGEIVYKLNLNYPRQKYIQISNEEALEDINHSITLDANNPFFRKVLSDYYFFIEDDLDTAIVIISQAIKIDPKNPSWYHRRAFLKAKHGLWDQACEDWKIGATLVGDDAELCKKWYDRTCK